MKKLMALKSFVVSAALVCGVAVNVWAEEETPPQTAWTYTGGVLTSDDGWKFTITDAGDGGVALASRSAVGTDMCLNLRTAETVIGKPITVFGRYVFSNPTGGGTVIHKGAQYGNTRKWLVPHNFNVGMMVLVR